MGWKAVAVNDPGTTEEWNDIDVSNELTSSHVTFILLWMVPHEVRIEGFGGGSSVWLVFTDGTVAGLAIVLDLI